MAVASLRDLYMQTKNLPVSQVPGECCPSCLPPGLCAYSLRPPRCVAGGGVGGLTWPPFYHSPPSPPPTSVLKLSAWKRRRRYGMQDPSRSECDWGDSQKKKPSGTK
ncbi:T. brucei spp.-specific protein [Trypanosoma brucei gambiense DAL972]|uniref:T. brucei spp.-specific protein n=1 Tax=Trypanosoma brucei gambiense (strain MHOM/CI/86/DAL972) TaxID=679716 RepID=C9ZUX1_TRYB9|nr:T. brucei spp.-specific protein [Trypanosoma brucei gambiense DAL972]CBH13209.1 T. brucei spp.-specific protein [Trypanosoma brucei gambiense DAL972]|eukprot:XP_011775486.1 T. brucei spp.-specific protein [Trypanosoma brucei gambiense DAL972]